MTSCSKELGPLPKPKRPLQITTRTLKEPDFKFELLPLHSPLLGQSLLVSFPPLIVMLKFSGYSYLIRGQPLESGGFNGRNPRHARSEVVTTTLGVTASPPLVFGACGSRRAPTQARGLMVEMTLEQACPPEYWRAQCAFKDSMIH